MLTRITDLSRTPFFQGTSRRSILVCSLALLAACTGTIDDDDTETGVEPDFFDQDGDGYTPSDGDCDDDDPAISPEADELCDEIDNNCDGRIDEEPLDGIIGYPDDDDDGYGQDGDGEAFCDLPDGFVDRDGDCDDNEERSYPGAPEICDGEDNDCNGRLPVEEEDADGDGLPGCNDTDRDGDGLSNDAETAGLSGYVTDPDNPDTDGDGVIDGRDALPLNEHCARELMFETNFDMGGAWWDVVAGGWFFGMDGDNQYVYNTPTAAGETAWLWEESWSDMVVQARVRATAGSAGHNSGLIFRVQNGGNSTNNSQLAYWVGLNHTDDVVQFGFMDGRWTQLALEPYRMDADTWYDLRVHAIGDQIDIFVNDTNVISMRGDTYAYGSVGMRTWWQPMQYDDLLICQ